MNNSTCPFWQKYQWYWNNRYNLFSKFDEWIQIDETALYSVRAENSAIETWKTLKWEIVLDAFWCVWGSTIWFALTGKKVISVEIDNNRLEMARNNARIYWVENKIEFINWDILDIIWELKFDSVFFDPPWWWLDYSNINFFKFLDFNPNGDLLMKLALQKTKNIAFGLPNNFDLNELSKYWDNYFLQENKINWARWFYTVYFNHN